MISTKDKLLEEDDYEEQLISRFKTHSPTKESFKKMKTSREKIIERFQQKIQKEKVIQHQP